MLRYFCQTISTQHCLRKQFVYSSKQSENVSIQLTFYPKRWKHICGRTFFFPSISLSVSIADPKLCGDFLIALIWRGAFDDPLFSQAIAHTYYCMNPVEASLCIIVYRVIDFSSVMLSGVHMWRGIQKWLLGGCFAGMGSLTFTLCFVKSYSCSLHRLGAQYQHKVTFWGDIKMYDRQRCDILFAIVLSNYFNLW